LDAVAVAVIVCGSAHEVGTVLGLAEGRSALFPPCWLRADGRQLAAAGLVFGITCLHAG